MSQRADKAAMDSGMMPAAVKDRSTEKDAGPRVTGMGNSATASLLGGTVEGKEIPPDLRARMEQSFGVDLRGVRVRDDSAARNAAESLDAQAYVEGGQIHWGASAPPLNSEEAAPVLAHEVSHVVQQRQASSIEHRMSKPGEASEVHADVMAGQALAGQRASAGSPGAVAAAQRQPRDELNEGLKAEAEVALTAFLQKVASTRPPQDIRKAQVVKDALTKLAFAGGPMAGIGVDVDKFMASAPNDPAKMAKAFVAKLTRVTKASIDALAKARFIDAPASTASRVGNLVEKSKAGGPDRPAEPGYVSPEDKAQDIQDKSNAMRGTKGPTTYGPGAVDVLQLGRILGGAKKALKPPVTKAAPIEAESYPQVEAAIAKIPKDALVPGEAKGKGQDDNWADAQEFARDLARRLDIAQKSKQEKISINLSDNYAGVRDRDAMRDAVDAIIAQIRQALPHHASGVKHAEVRTGKTLLTLGRAETP